MATAELRRAIERLRQFRGALQQQLRASSRAPASTAERLGLPLDVGERVFDTVTGLEGEVIDGTTENVLIPATEKRVG